MGFVWCVGSKLDFPNYFIIYWKVVKMPRSLEEMQHYEAGRCPQCGGRGAIPVTSTTRYGMGGKTGTPSVNVMPCPSCEGSGKPDDEIWGDDGIMEED